MGEAAILALQDGTILRGQAAGASGIAVGEVCFNTAMSGYQEICTDPSYARQLVTFTCPHIGNVGTNPIDAESPGVQLAGMVVRDLPRRTSNWRSQEDLSDYLRRAIALRLPIFGICYGHQLLGHALGGEVGGDRRYAL